MADYRHQIDVVFVARGSIGVESQSMSAEATSCQGPLSVGRSVAASDPRLPLVIARIECQRIDDGWGRRCRISAMDADR